MKKRIKSPVCPNCAHPLKEADNFCPECGQENNNIRQSFGKMMFDLITSFLSLDSKFANSLIPILFKPGFLTKEYIKGKHKKYLAPARMYITIVVLYFLISSIGGTRISNEKIDSTDSTQVDGHNLTLIQEGPLSFKVTGIENDTTTLQSNGSFSALSDSSDKTQYAYIRSVIKSGVTNTDHLIERLELENTFWNRFYYSQVIKLVVTDFEDLKSYFSDKMPWIFFSLMPVFALILKLIYIRRKSLYIDHLVFAFHLHTFYFILAVISNLLYKIIGFDNDIYAVIISVIYSFVAFKKFYTGGYIRTFVNMLFTLIFYLIAAFISIILLLLIMFAAY